MAKRKQYNDEFRASAKVMLEVAGYPETIGALAKVASHLKVPERTLSRWFRGENNPPPDKLVRVKKGNLADALEDIAWRLVRHVKDPEVISEMTGQQAATSIGILIDKIRLLREEPTERIAVDDWHSQAIEDIKAGKLSYLALVEAFDDDLATRLFREAGITVSSG